MQAFALEQHLSPSTFRRNWNAKGCSYQEIKDEVRRGVAFEQLRESRASISDIAEQLGFQEPSAFHRAFKKWTGESQGRYQARYQGIPNRVFSEHFVGSLAHCLTMKRFLFKRHRSHVRKAQNLRRCLRLRQNRRLVRFDPDLSLSCKPRSSVVGFSRPSVVKSHDVSISRVSHPCS